MDHVELPATEAAVRRFLEELWLPYDRELEATVERFALAAAVDLVAEEVSFRLDRLDSDGYRTWITVDGATDAAIVADMDGEFVGFVAAERGQAASVFDRPDRLFVRDVYVREPYPGTELATDLFDRLGAWARETGCTEFGLDVNVDNERAIAFSERPGSRRRSTT